MNWQIENFLEARKNQLFMDGIPTVKLVEKYGTPLFVFSESRIKSNIARLRQAESAIDCKLKICYAAKANSNMAILRVIREANCDLEVNSGGELWKALKIGFSGEQIIFNGTSKEIWELENAINAEIYAIQVDSIYELSLIEQTAKRLGKVANVSLRLVPEIRTGTHSGLQTALLTSKFGMMPDEALSALQTYKDSEFLHLCGIHLHIGSQTPESKAYAEALHTLFDNLLQIYQTTGLKLSHLNLGGGFPVNYLRDPLHAEDFAAAEKEMLSADYEPAQALGNAWREMKTAAQNAGAQNLLENLTLLLEPGRSIISDAGICLTKVCNVKTRPISNFNRRTDHWLLTDAGFNILLSMETYKWYYHLIHAERAEERHDFPYKVAGPLCDGGDVYFDIEGQRRLPDYRLLPPNVRPDEVLALLNCGAYSIAQMFPYNGRFLPCVVLIRENGKVEVIRQRDSFADLILNEVF